MCKTVHLKVFEVLNESARYHNRSLYYWIMLHRRHNMIYGNLTLPGSLIYMINRTDPRTLLWRTPLRTGIWWEKVVSILASKLRWEIIIWSMRRVCLGLRNVQDYEPVYNCRLCRTLLRNPNKSRQWVHFHPVIWSRPLN